MEERRDHIRSALTAIGDLRPGSLRHRYQKCGKPNCRCKQAGHPGHGPYFVLLCEVAGKKTTRSIPAARVDETRAQVDECQRLRRLTGELIEVSEQLCDARLQTAGADARNAKKKPARSSSDPCSKPSGAASRRMGGA